VGRQRGGVGALYPALGGGEEAVQEREGRRGGGAVWSAMARGGGLGAAGGGRRPQRVGPVGQRLREGEEVGGPRDWLGGPERGLGRQGRKEEERNVGWWAG
jgi:hypothetical protein